MGVSNKRSAGGSERPRTRESFNTVAGLYDRYRRGYPREIVDQMMADARIGTGSRVLEIGPGTGQLTVPVLERGAAVTAVELGEALAAVVRQKTNRFPHGEIVVSSFEDWALPSQPFDAVIAATSFHWLDPAVRADKCAQALRSSGTLLAVYPDIDQCAGFARVERRRIRRTIRYTSDEYAGLLSTDSLVLTLDPQARTQFLAEIRSLADPRYGGWVSRDYLYEIVAARSESGPNP